MDFQLTDEQLMLQDSAQKFVERSYPFEKRRELADSALGFGAENWRSFAELGWLALPFAEDSGGLGGGNADMMVLQEVLGQALVTEPIIPNVVLCGGLIERLDGVESVWGEEEKRANGLDHERSGELIAVAQADRWFSYYYWLDDRVAPDFARTVDIHRKPGYDPVELFFDPALTAPKLKAAWIWAPWVSRTTLGRPVVPPVWNRAQTASGSCAGVKSRSRARIPEMAWSSASIPSPIPAPPPITG